MRHFTKITHHSNAQHGRCLVDTDHRPIIDVIHVMVSRPGKLLKDNTVRFIYLVDYPRLAHFGILDKLKHMDIIPC